MFLWDVSHFESFVSIYSSFVPRLLTCVFFLGFMSTLFLVPINRPQWATLTLRLSFFHWKRKRAGERERERCRPCLRQKVQAYKADRVHFTICLGSQPDLWFAVSLAALAVFISLPFCSAMSERAQEWQSYQRPGARLLIAPVCPPPSAIKGCYLSVVPWCFFHRLLHHSAKDWNVTRVLWILYIRWEAVLKKKKPVHFIFILFIINLQWFRAEKMIYCGSYPV